MASAISLAIDSDLIRLLRLASSEKGIEFVQTTSVNSDSSIRCTAGPERTACVAQADTLAAPFSSNASAPFTSVPAVSIRSSTSRQFRPATSPTTFMTSASLASSRRLSIIANGAFSLLANPRARSAPRVRRNHRQVGNVARPEILDHHRHGEQMIYRYVEEALDLRCVQVEGQNPIRPSRLQYGGYQPRRNRHPGLVLTVLPRIPIIG